MLIPHSQSTAVKRIQYSSENGARRIFGRMSMRQLPKRCTAIAQNPGSRRLWSCVTQSSSIRSQNEMPEGFSLVAPLGSGGCSGVEVAVGGAVIARLDGPRIQASGSGNMLDASPTVQSGATALG